MAASNIEWTESTWNPVTGCTKVSPGCKNCYAERMAKRLKSMGVEKYKDGFRLVLHPEVLDEPLNWLKPQYIFVNSMSDLFHKDVPVDFVLSIFDVMRRAQWHQFQILTKRAEHLLELDSALDWSQNVWMGVSVESAECVYRIDMLRQTHAPIKFLSLEPLLGALSNLDLRDIHWVIVGGESGPHARPMEQAWVREIRDQCEQANVPFFFKQWGGTRKKKAGRLLDSRTWDELPRELVAA